MEAVSFQIVYTPDEDGYNALEPITGTTSWGKDLTEAQAMITEALELYFEEVGREEIPQAGTVVIGSASVRVAA